MKTFILMVLFAVPAVAETQSECIARVKTSLQACGEVCDQTMSKQKDIDACFKSCGQEAREAFIGECKVPLKR